MSFLKLVLVVPTAATVISISIIIIVTGIALHFDVVNHGQQIITVVYCVLLSISSNDCLRHLSCSFLPVLHDWEN